MLCQLLGKFRIIGICVTLKYHPKPFLIIIDHVWKGVVGVPYSSQTCDIGLGKTWVSELFFNNLVYLSICSCEISSSSNAS